ncbi:MAG TPA: hypothetical protein VHE30_01575 [Polyangiaceae bacterium]|nr:hypothetical protein [Polyangiaceae bacterium]
MRRIPSNLFLFIAALAGIASSACQSGGVGDPCIPEDEYRSTFSGYQPTEVNVESRSFQCETRVCLVANFAGRVTCPYGQPDPVAKGSAFDQTTACYRPGTKSEPDPPGTSATSGTCSNCVSVQVTAQKQIRPPNTAVYCSCRCDGPDKNVRYCECPSGFSCQKLVTDYGFGSGQLAGSYCIKDGTAPPQGGDFGTDCSLPAAPRPIGCGTDLHPTGY